MASLPADVDNIFEMRGTKHETSPFELADDTVHATLFRAPSEMQPDPCGHEKRHCSSHSTEGEHACARKMEHPDVEAAGEPI